MGKVIFIIIKAALKAVSPALRDLLENFYLQIKEAAAATDNEWDDVLVAVVGVLFGFED